MTLASLLSLRSLRNTHAVGLSHRLFSAASCIAVALLVAGWFASSPVCAQATDAASATAQPLSRSVYLQRGDARAGTRSDTVGVTLPWDWPGNAWDHGVTGYWDVYASQWAVDDARPGPRHYLFAGVTPVLRYRLDGGRSRVFAEAGVGIALSDKRYQSVFEQFSTRYNFASHLGVGFNLGAKQQHEFSLRYEHFSNGGLREPNPGENFRQFRYAYLF